ncbi:hypothetical protein EUTSA_v10026610mg [Eutrema salsugineum]|uniref:Uncharacterized protein n=1 Tax=Eutrema salsugineum TaxID=72664 RepID=V4MLI3_EUTSA|nr:hypothetical protein EUTSA_v10026610mg [Eutrema salsugineum]
MKPFLFLTALYFISLWLLSLHCRSRLSPPLYPEVSSLYTLNLPLFSFFDPFSKELQFEKVCQLFLVFGLCSVHLLDLFMIFFWILQGKGTPLKDIPNDKDWEDIKFDELSMS